MQLVGPPLLRPRITNGKPFPPNAARKPTPPPDFPLEKLLSLLTQNASQSKNQTLLLQNAWKSDPITTLELITHLCNHNQEAFYAAALWLHQNHPLTLACNISVFVNLGCLKHALEILRAVLADDHAEGEPEEKEGEIAMARVTNSSVPRYPFVSVRRHRGPSDLIQNRSDRYLRRSRALLDLFCIRSDGPQCLRTEAQGISRHRRPEVMAKRVVCKYRYDSDYRYLHERVSDLFAEALKSDLGFLKSGEPEKVSLASKHCPSVDSLCDESTLICESIARKMFPRACDPSYERIEEARYAYRVRERLREEVLVPLRESLRRREESLSRPMKTSVVRSRNKFRGVDRRFRFYVRIAVDYANAFNFGSSSGLAHRVNSVSENLSKRLGKDLLKRENLKNSIVVCDAFSGSKNAATIDIRVAMSLLVSELCEMPWKSKAFTFSEYPKLRKIEGDSPYSKGQFIQKNLDCGEKIDFGKVFDRILQVWMTERLSKDQMVKRVFVFTEREFNEAAKRIHKGEYNEVWEGYKKRGHKSVPEVVFCSLRGCVTCLMTICGPKGVISIEEVMVGGLLKSLTSLYMEKEGFEGADVLIESIQKRRDDAVRTQCGRDKYEELDLVVLD